MANRVRAKLEAYEEYARRMPALAANRPTISLDERSYSRQQSSRNTYRIVPAYAWTLNENRAKTESRGERSGDFRQGEAMAHGPRQLSMRPRPSVNRRASARRRAMRQVSADDAYRRSARISMSSRSADDPGRERRGRDSNPRYRFTPHDSLANCCLQPLGHLSGDRIKVKPLPRKGKRPSPHL
jgi:hypothetical protein